MNVSHDLKTIWWLPEQTGEDVTTNILEKCGFTIEDDMDYPDYTLICNMRNPYDRILSLYFKKHFNNRLIKKELTSSYKIMFNEWIKEAFISNKLIVTTSNLPKFTKREGNILDRWHFNNQTPNKFVRIENYKNEMSKIEFIKNSDKFKTKELNGLLETNFKEQRTFGFDEMYTFESAKKIYHFHKKHFYLCGYNPFSFTKENLSDQEKISFIHDIV
jgi:hypothetical protein